MLADHRQLLYFAVITNNDSNTKFYVSPEEKNIDMAVMKEKKKKTLRSPFCIASYKIFFTVRVYFTSDLCRKNRATDEVRHHHQIFNCLCMDKPISD